MDPLYYLFAFLIAAFALRIIFSVGNIVRNMQAQTKLLALIASKLGNDNDEIVAIIGKSNMPRKKNPVTDPQ